LRSNRGEGVDQTLIHAIESVVIDWSHQIQEVLKKDSSQPLLEGLNPGPLVEIEFWKAKTANLENIYDQVRKRLRWVEKWTISTLFLQLFCFSSKS
jgi:hypothetical protein